MILTLVFERTAATGRANSARMQGTHAKLVARTLVRSLAQKTRRCKELDRPQFELRPGKQEYTTNYPLTSEMSAIDPLRDEKRDPDANETPVFIVEAADRKLVNEE